jgi:hypothetical protein
MRKKHTAHLCDDDFVDHGRMNQDIRINIKQVWKRKSDGLLVRVNGVIFLEPKRVMWQALPNHNNPPALGTINESEFKEQFEYQHQTASVQN